MVQRIHQMDFRRINSILNRSFYPVFILFFLTGLFSHSTGVILRLKNGNPLEGKLISVEDGKLSFESGGMIMILPVDRVIPPDLEWLEEAEKALSDKEFDKAYDYCRQVLIWNPENPKAGELRSVILQKKDEDKKEIEKIRLTRQQEELEKETERIKSEEEAKAVLEAERRKPMDILQKVASTYKNLTSYSFEINQTMEMVAPGMQQKQEIPMTVAAVKPGKMRMELKSGLMEMLLVSDGETTWLYIPMTKQYIKYTGSPLKGNLGGQGNEMANFLDLISELEKIAENVKEVRLLREESLQVGDQSVDCYVIRVEKNQAEETGLYDFGPTTYWIDKKRYIPLKQVEAGLIKGQQMGIKITALMISFKINEPIPDRFFTFTPPPDAKEGSSGAGKNYTDLTGQKAMEFILKDTKGQSVNLKYYQNRVILLDFWASWCPPCRRELPIIEKLYNEYKTAGLVVLGINNEDPVTARNYIQKNNLTFPVLLDTDNTVSELYKIEAIPTVVIIGRDGMIKKHFIGARSESELRSVLNQEGIR